MGSNKSDLTSLESSLGQTFYHNMKKYSDRILQYIADTDETDTYQQVLTRSIRTALRMKERGVKKGDIISLCSYSHKNICVPLVAAFFIGAVPANFDPNLSYADVLKLFNLVKPKMVFTCEESLPVMEKCIEEVKSETQLVVFDGSKVYSSFSEFLEPHPDENGFRPTEIDSRETAVIMFTSGTTGAPKGICISHRSITVHEKNNDLFVGMANVAHPISLFYTTFYWVSGLLFLAETIITGGARVVCMRCDPKKMWQVLEKYKVNVTFLPPSAANETLTYRPKNVDTSSLRIFSTGGFPVSTRLMGDLRAAFPNTAILQVYAQTEASSIVAKFDPLKPGELEMQYKKPLSCRKIVSSFKWKVVDPDTEEKLGPNQSGELRIKSDFVMNGFYKLDSSSSFDSEGYLKTGDIVYYDEDDCLFIVDRIKEVFKYKGWQIMPAVLEEVLMSHPAVKEAIVISIPHAPEGEYPMGVVVLYDEYKDVTPKEVQEFVDAKVSDFQRLRAGVYIVDSIQKTATGKVRRKDLREVVIGNKNWIATSAS